MATQTTVEARFKIAGVLLILGLLAEGLCLLWARPLSFVLMICLGGPLVFAGIVVYLLAIATSPAEHGESS